MLACSHNLVELIGKDAIRRPDVEVSLELLCTSFSSDIPGQIKGAIRGIVLLKRLGDVTKRDSAVQDIVTRGHLGKLLLRWDMLDAEGAYNLIGLPHRSFDALSASDREDFFKRGGNLNRLDSKEQVEMAQMILERERKGDE